MPVEFYTSKVAVLVNAADPTMFEVRPVATLPDFEEWTVYEDVSEFGKDGVPVAVTSRAVTRPIRRVKASMSVVYDKGVEYDADGKVTSVPTMAVIRVDTKESTEALVVADAVKLDEKNAEAFYAANPTLEAKFADQPVAAVVEVEPIAEEPLGG
jgi:hypothetical protein